MLITQYFFRLDEKTGKLVGHDVDLAKDISKKLGVQLEFDRSSPNWDGLIKLVEEGKVDIALGNVSKTLDRSKRIYYTNPYLILNKTLLVNRVWLAKQHFKYPAKDLIKAKFTIAAIEGNAYTEFARKAFPKAVLKFYTNWDQSLQALLEGEVDTVFQDEFKIRKFILENPEVAVNYKAIIYRNYNDYIAIPVAHNNMALLHWLNFYLQESKKGFNSQKLIEDYIKPKN